MSLIATINGKKVYSDKPVVAITDTRVHFADGSWCDTHTGNIHNAGSGYINIGGGNVPENDKPITEGPKQVQASALEVRGVAADVQVDVHRESFIEYTISGAAEEVKAITAGLRGDTLVIESDGKGRSGGSHTIIQSGGGRNSISIGSNIHIGGVRVFGGRNSTTTISTGNGDGGSAVKVTVKVPEGTPVTAMSILGDVRIGNTHGPLIALVQSGDDVRAGRVTSADLTVQGSGDIDVKEVLGHVTATVQGSGDIDIDKGSITSLTATVQGSGDITVGGSADSATLNVMGSGDIDVAHVKQRPLKSVIGSGDITVGRIG